MLENYKYESYCMTDIHVIQAYLADPSAFAAAAAPAAAVEEKKEEAAAAQESEEESDEDFGMDLFG